MHLLPVLGVGLLLSGLGAQSPVPSAGVDPTDPTFVVPLHSHADDPDYGVWAGGSTWKARFDDGFRFFPRLGAAAPRNLPLAWRTTACGIGVATPVADGDAAERTWTATRYEIRRATFVERYDVGAAGVEQSFVFDAPHGDGDLVVEGAITTELRAAPRGFAHGPLEFRGPDDAPVLEYGAAFAFDAAGHRIAIDTAFDGSRIRLRVPAAWLATASWPVTIDPLTQTTTIMALLDNGPESVTIGRNDVDDELCVAFTRSFAAGDRDLYVRVMDDAFGNRDTIYTDFADDHDSTHAAVDFVAGPSRWVVAFENGLPVGRRVQLYFHDGGVGSARTGNLVTVADGLAFALSRPSFGGSIDGSDFGYLTWQRDLTGTSDDSRVYGARIDARLRTVGPITNLHQSIVVDYDADHPNVSRASGGDGWLVVWQEYNHANVGDDWDVLGQRIDHDGALSTWAPLGPDADATLHKQRPKVAGTGGTFMVAFTTRTNVGDKPNTGIATTIRTQPVNWLEATTPHEPATQLVASSPALTLDLGEDATTIAFHATTRSHWAVLYTDLNAGQYVTRCGFDGIPVETALTRASGPTSHDLRGGACFDADGNRFALVTGYQGGLDAAEGRHLLFRDAQANRYGTSCAGTIEAFAFGEDLPYAGSARFFLDLHNGRPLVPTFLLVSLGPADLPLPLGASGCRLLLDANVFLAVYGGSTSGPAGHESHLVLLPGASLDANLYWQYVQVDGNELVSSDAMQTLIR